MRPALRDLVLNAADAPDASLSLDRYERLQCLLERRKPTGFTGRKACSGNGTD